MHHWFYIEQVNFLSQPSLRLKARWLRQRLLPGTAYLKHFYGQGQGAGIAYARYFRKGLRNLLG